MPFAFPGRPAIRVLGDGWSFLSTSGRATAPAAAPRLAEMAATPAVSLASGFLLRRPEFTRRVNRRAVRAGDPEPRLLPDAARPEVRFVWPELLLRRAPLALRAVC